VAKSEFKNWAKDQGKKKVEAKRDFDLYQEGKFLYYHPTFSPSDEIKELSGVRWDRRRQAWRLPRLTRAVTRVRTLDPDARVAQLGPLSTGDWAKTDLEVTRSFEFYPARYKDLYPFQKESVHALTTRAYHGTGLILSPGLGKTPTSIIAADTWCAERGESQRVLVVAPLALVRNWEREILKWSADPRVEVCHGVGPTPDRSVRYTVTNYDTLHERQRDHTTGIVKPTGNLNEDWDLDWDIVIFDESVLLKNRKSKRAQACRTLAATAQKVWLLSGAPTTRDNSDLWQQMNIMEPEFFTSFWGFAKEFCIVVETPWSQFEIMGSRRNVVVRDEFPEMLVVRNQDDVLPDLPEYIFQDIELELQPRQKKAHEDLMTQWLHELEENRDKRVEVTAVIAQLVRLQQVTSNLYNLETTGTSWPDCSAKADFVQDLLKIGSVEWPVLIWTHHRPGARALYERLTKIAKSKKGEALKDRRIELVYGGVKNADAIIEDYKAGKVDVLILGIQVGKYGHTLTNTRTVVAYDKTWDSDAWFQMLHRVRRHGLKHSPLFITLRCRGTIDDYVELNLAGKLPPMADMTGAQLARILRSLGEDHV
jgi:SNF2 family DNA or RNA helicase